MTFHVLYFAIVYNQDFLKTNYSLLYKNTIFQMNDNDHDDDDDDDDDDAFSIKYSIFTLICPAFMTNFSKGEVKVKLIFTSSLG